MEISNPSPAEHLAHALAADDKVACEASFQPYLQALLKPDAQEAIGIASAYLKGPAQLMSWLEDIIQPTMYAIGELWAKGEISVGQEHVATAITQRVMASYYPMILAIPRLKGPIVATASPGELHEIGIRIVADMLEVHGWNVYCSGANMPTYSTIELLERTEACFLCISTTLITSLPAVQSLITQVRAANLRARPKILVGGQAYKVMPNLWRQVGADWFAYSVRDGIAYIEANQSADHNQPVSDLPPATKRVQ